MVIEEKQTGLPAALASRVSTKEQEEDENIEAHVSELRTFMEKEGNYLWDEERGVYKDEGYSGALLARPDLDRLRDDAKRGKYKIVYFLSTDRLARDNHIVGLVVTELKELGIRVVFKNTPVADDPVGDLMLNIFGSFGQFDRAKIADQFRRGKRHKAADRKLIVGSVAPYGFRYIKEDKENNRAGYYKKEPQEILIVKKMFDLADRHGYSAHKLAKWLTEQNIPTAKGGKKWHCRTVVRILRRSEYIGIAYYNKHKRIEPQNPRSVVKYKRQLKTSTILRPKEEWISIAVPECKCIDKGQFRRVQERLDENTRYAKRNTKHLYLLARLLRCAKPCGCSWTGRNVQSRFFYYSCSNSRVRYPLPKTCDAKMIRAEVVDDVVWRVFCKIFLNPKILMEHAIKLQEKHRQRSDIAEQIRLEQQSIAGLEQTEKRVFEAYKAGVVDLRKLNEEMPVIKGDIEKHKRRLSHLMSEKESVIPPELIKKSVSEFCAYLRQQLGLLEKYPERRQKQIRLFMKEGIVDGDNIVFGLKIPREYEYAFAGRTYLCSSHKRQDNDRVVLPEIGFKVRVHTKTGRYRLLV